jgi:hypothetical protein
MPTYRNVQTLTGLSSTAGFPFFNCEDYTPFNVGVSVTSNSSNVYNVEATLDFGSSVFNSSAATWFSSLASQLSSNNLFNITVPVSALRLNVTAGTSTLPVTVTRYFLSEGQADGRSKGRSTQDHRLHKLHWDGIR